MFNRGSHGRSDGETQADDGGWTHDNNDYEGVGPVYTTLVAVIALSVPAGYLPIFQR